jgi:serine protease AprX
MKKTFWIIFSSIVFTFFAISSPPAGEIDPHISAILGQLNSEDEISIIITLADQLDISSYRGNNKGQRRSRINKALRDKANKTQKPLKNFLKQKNARKIKPFWIFNGISVTIPAEAVNELAARPEVQSIKLDGTLVLPSPTLAAAGVPEWNLNTVDAPTLWALGHTGVGVVIASMDSGVDVAHPDLASRWRGGNNSWFEKIFVM